MTGHGHRRPNDHLRRAREGELSPSGSGRHMSRQELADAASSHLRQPISGSYIAKLERGEVRWPSKANRDALRAVLGAREDRELGFYITRENASAPPAATLGDVASLVIRGARADTYSGVPAAGQTADIVSIVSGGPLATRVLDEDRRHGPPTVLPAVLALARALSDGVHDAGAAAVARMLPVVAAESRSAQVARSLASSAPPIVVPQRRVSPQRLRGRAELLQRLDNMIIAIGEHRDRPGQKLASVVVLHGIGGAGKTTIALEVAHRARGSGLVTWWIPAEDSNAMLAALVAVAFAAGATDSDFDHAHPADVLWSRLDALGQPWLLVVDNADDPAKLGVSGRTLSDGTGWLRPPTGPWGTVLLTSRDGRSESWASWIRLHHVAMLDPASGARVLVDLAPRAGRLKDARLLAAALGGLPLALDLAGRHLASAAADLLPSGRAASFETYLTTLNHDPAEAAMSSDDPSSTAGDRRPLSATWEMSLDLLTGQGYLLARPLLRLVACFAEAPLPHGVLRPELLVLSPLFPDATAQRLNASLRALVDIGLLTLDMGTDQRSSVLTMHPVVRAATRANTELSVGSATYLELLTNLLAAATEELDPDSASDWPQWSVLAPHCFVALKRVSPNADLVASWKRALLPARRAAWYRYMAGLYEPAAADFLSIANLAESVLGSTHPDALDARSILARCVREMGDHERAEADLRALLHTARAALGDHPVTINIHINLARTIREQGRSAAAEAEFRAIVDLAHRLLGADHADTLVAWINLAVAIREQGRHPEAEEQYRGVLEAWRRTHSEENLTTLDLRYELAENLRQGGDPRAAEEELRAVLAIAQPVYGNDHPNTLIVRQGLANALRESGQVEAAREELQEVLRLRRTRLGIQHPFTEDTRRTLHSIDVS